MRYDIKKILGNPVLRKRLLGGMKEFIMAIKDDTPYIVGESNGLQKRSKQTEQVLPTVSRKV